MQEFKAPGSGRNLRLESSETCRMSGRKIARRWDSQKTENMCPEHILRGTEKSDAKRIGEHNGWLTTG